MCGRYSITTPVEAMRGLFDFIGPALNLAPRYNAAPTQMLPIVTEGRKLTLMRWGLVPLWAKDIKIGYKLINARTETVAEKPSFRTAFKERRCLVPAAGFYEWAKVDGGKQPYRVTLANEKAFAFAGLWESWTVKQDGGGVSMGDEVRSFTIVTTTANDFLRPIHGRMPVILDDYDTWLEGSTDDASALLRPYEGDMKAYQVSSHVNSPKNDDALCIQPTA